ncbi:hypothetical protein DCCM_2512 [Desulfocucumis palustris]|uniref:Uncharacterized protein n=1 Tax=Desulfocucumis palustris TaxID=1898651 RepID=A0A2L2XHQ8_9FIRM|nr:hypothetical protein DCCM_2512 [Desulfocucumis palustris]
MSYNIKRSTLAISDGGLDGRPIPEEEYMDANISSFILARDHLLNLT